MDNDQNGICDLLEHCTESHQINYLIDHDTIIVARERIISSGVIADNFKVTFSAGTELIFDKGFEISPNAQFKAVISTCHN